MTWKCGLSMAKTHWQSYELVVCKADGRYLGGAVWGKSLTACALKTSRLWWHNRLSLTYKNFCWASHVWADVCYWKNLNLNLDLTYIDIQKNQGEKIHSRFLFLRSKNRNLESYIQSLLLLFGAMKKLESRVQSGLVFILIRYFSEAIFYQDDTTRIRNYGEIVI